MRSLENPGEVTTEETVSKGRVDLALRLKQEWLVRVIIF